MADYVFNDEDNNPMIETDTDRIMKYTTYSSRAEMQAFESGMAGKKEKQANGCWNCWNYDWKREACTLNWNNMDESYYNPDTDKHDPDYCCEHHDLDPDVKPEDWDFGGNEP